MQAPLITEEGAVVRMPRSWRLIPLRQGQKFPPSHDPKWKEWCRPLWTYLRHPRSWTDLKAWTAINNINRTITRQMLAWLEDRSLAHYDVSTKMWVAQGHFHRHDLRNHQSE